MHSPFVFDFIRKVLRDKSEHHAYEKIEDLRSSLKNEKRALDIQDFGAGTVFTKSNQRTVSSIARSAAKPAKYAQLLHRMVKHYQPATILELGTSLGITSAYLATGNLQAKVYTLEGATAIGNEAVNNFAKLNISNIQLIPGNFDETLVPLLATLQKIDFAFIDGNHRVEPTVRYFEKILQKTHNDSILVFDDIHWSQGMEQAWSTIKNHESVTATIDLFFIGIVLFRKEFREKRQFSIRF